MVTHTMCIISNYDSFICQLSEFPASKTWAALPEVVSLVWLAVNLFVSEMIFLSRIVPITSSSAVKSAPNKNKWEGDSKQPDTNSFHLQRSHHQALGRGRNKVRNALVANRSVFTLFLTELNPTILKMFHVSQSVSDYVTDWLTDCRNC